MSTDRELLELAAKAADMGELDFDYPEREGHAFNMGPRLTMPKGVLMAANWTYWNPLTDDGDALRLAVDLNLSITLNSWGAGVGGVDKNLSQVFEREKSGTGGLRAAARRAIVLAAAEIGRRMP